VRGSQRFGVCRPVAKPAPPRTSVEAARQSSERSLRPPCGPPLNSSIARWQMRAASPRHPRAGSWASTGSSRTSWLETSADGFLHHRRSSGAKPCGDSPLLACVPTSPVRRVAKRIPGVTTERQQSGLEWAAPIACRRPRDIATSTAGPLFLERGSSPLPVRAVFEHRPATRSPIGIAGRPVSSAFLCRASVLVAPRIALSSENTGALNRRGGGRLPRKVRGKEPWVTPTREAFIRLRQRLGTVQTLTSTRDGKTCP
jgi:hypothetical protein